MIGVVIGLSGDDAGGLHLTGALGGVLDHGQIGRLSVDAVECDGCGGGVGVRLGGRERGFLGGDLVEDLLLVKLGEGLAPYAPDR